MIHAPVDGKKRVLLSIFLMLTLFVLGSCTNDTGNGDEEETLALLTSAQLAERGEYEVVYVEDFPVFDSQTGREFVLQIYYPSVYQKQSETGGIDHFPLIISVHGGGAMAKWGDEHFRYLSSYGFVIIAPEFPHTNFQSNPLNVNDVINQPRDISFVIDGALGINNQLPEAVTAVVDEDRIGIGGVSLGGFTSLLSGFDQEYRDDRIGAVIATAPAGADFLLPSFYADAATPLLLMHGDVDGFIDYETVGKTVYRNASAPTYFLTIFGGTHSGFESLLGGIEAHNLDGITCVTAPALIENGSTNSAWVTLQTRGESFGMGGVLAPLPCTYGAHEKPGIGSNRQLELAKLANLAFYKMVFDRVPDTQELYRYYFLNTLALENDELGLQFKE